MSQLTAQIILGVLATGLLVLGIITEFGRFVICCLLAVVVISLVVMGALSGLDYLVKTAIG